ncbi:YacL family protein [Flocculibacter collagenilyticus]|uniref:YacL family protein n=1 Tax=Flocculibacter collagenilyticus TaxID=2744479 RepID=UPI0018F4E824|nr:YacL family protein [Flocculibacter collagenilyticus]
MEYEFLYDSITGGFHVKISSEQAVFGRWLSEEIGKSADELEKVFNVIDLANASPHQELRLIGKEFTLTLNQMEAEVTANVMQADELGDDYAEQDLYVELDGHAASCGIEDLVLLLNAWQDFIQN